MAKILVLNPREDSPCIYYDGVLEVVDEFKYLGTIFNKDRMMHNGLDPS
jgi:hypothetical protein